MTKFITVWIVFSFLFATQFSNANELENSSESIHTCFLLKMVDVLRCVTLNKITVTFGFTGEDITAKYSFPFVQEDILLKYLTFFLEDDAELEHIKKEYGEGRMLAGAVEM
ncbi:hypothetical protein Bca101_088624 [Brassica carinata]|nr:unnamed protein product [Brassica oleracea]